VGWGTVDGVFCHNCGHRNPEGVNFCSSCGNALLADGDDATITLHPTDEGETTEDYPDVTSVEIPHGAGVLVVTRGPNIGARYLLGEDVVKAGRHPESDIFLDDITVSRRHVEISPATAGLLGPRRGVAERHLREPGAHRRGPLAPGDEVQIGKFKLVYLVAGNE
jgi:pSer/pThr/pTyr-binding forkhead associated (FHA) protein